MGALSTYSQQVQDLLHDPRNQMWSALQVTSYINEARNRVAQDTKALRQIVTNAQYPTFQFAAGQEFITPQTFLPAPLGAKVVDVMGLTVIVNQQRLSLTYKPYSWINANLRAWVNYQSWPQFWTRVSPIQICIAPVPQIPYPCEADVAVNTTPLVTDATVDDLPIPFQECVQYYASMKAKLNQQSQGEAAMFKSMYLDNLRMCARAYMQRVIQNPYTAPLE